MSDPHEQIQPAPEHSHPAAPAPFSEDELHQLRTNDILAAKVIVSLMSGIFAVGLVLYTIILVTVLS